MQTWKLQNWKAKLVNTKDLNRGISIITQITCVRHDQLDFQMYLDEVDGLGWLNHITITGWAVKNIWFLLFLLFFSIITVEKIEAVRAELASWPKQHILKCLIVRKIFATSNRIKVTVAVISCHKKLIVIHDYIFAYKLYRVNADTIQHLQCIILCQWKPNWNKKVYIFSQKTVFWTKVSGFL